MAGGEDPFHKGDEQQEQLDSTSGLWRSLKRKPKSVRDETDAQPGPLSVSRVGGGARQDHSCAPPLLVLLHLGASVSSWPRTGLDPVRERPLYFPGSGWALGSLMPELRISQMLWTLWGCLHSVFVGGRGCLVLPHSCVTHVFVPCLVPGPLCARVGASGNLGGWYSKPAGYRDGHQSVSGGGRGHFGVTDTQECTWVGVHGCVRASCSGVGCDKWLTFRHAYLTTDEMEWKWQKAGVCAPACVHTLPCLWEVSPPDPLLSPPTPSCSHSPCLSPPTPLCL